VKPAAGREGLSPFPSAEEESNEED